MKQFFIITALLVVLGCVAFVGWQITVKPESDSLLQQVAQEQSVDVAAQSTVQSTTTQTVSTEESSLENIETEVVEDPKSDQVIVEQSTPETTSPVVASNETSRKEQLLGERRALAIIAYEQAPDLAPDVREAVENPSSELIDIFVAEFVAGSISEIELEEDYAIIDDWLEESLFAYMEEQGPFRLSGLRKEPLPEPKGYRTRSNSRGEDRQMNLLRYSITAGTKHPVEIYAVDADGNFSGIVHVNDEFQFPYSQVRNVKPGGFTDLGIVVDPPSAEEFNLMLRGTDFGIFPLHYSYYEDGKSVWTQIQIMTTLDMLASATVVSTDDRIDLYKWRIDYNGDGEIDFLVSHNGIDIEQATKMVDFVGKTHFLTEEDKNNFEEMREQFIDFLTKN